MGIELAPLPKKWQYVPLEELGKFDSGGTPSKAEPKYWGGNIPFVTGGDITNFYVSARNARTFLTREGLESGKTAICKPGTLMLVTRTGVGRVGIAKDIMGASQDLSPFTCNAKVLTEYLCWYLLSISEHLAENARGATIQGITREFVGSLQIPLPPLDEQKRIASIAQKCDRLRCTRRYTQQLSDGYLRSVFLEMFGDLENNSKQWNLIPFDEMCVIDAEMVDPKLEKYRKYLHIGGANIESITGKLLDLKTAEQEGLVSGKFLINPQHLIFSKIRPKLRKVAYPQMDALCSADIYPIRVASSECNPYFLLYYLRSEYFSQIVSELAESRTNIPKVNREELADLYIPSPPLSLQEKFAQIVQRFERLRIQQREADRQTEHLFQTVLDRAFRGEL